MGRDAPPHAAKKRPAGAKRMGRPPIYEGPRYNQTIGWPVPLREEMLNRAAAEGLNFSNYVIQTVATSMGFDLNPSQEQQLEMDASDDENLQMSA